MRILKNNICRILTFFFVLAAPFSAFAFPFIVDPADQSLRYLGQLFGSIGSVYLGGNSSPGIGAMIQEFNGWILVAAMTFMSYQAVVGAINTAQEGNFLGKAHNTFWEPTRTLIGILLMLPFPGSGYSIIQTTFMWVIVQGIGAANVVWGVALDYYASDASVFVVESDSDSIKTQASDNAIVKEIIPTRNSLSIDNANAGIIEQGIYENLLCTKMANVIASRGIAYDDPKNPELAEFVRNYYTSNVTNLTGVSVQEQRENESRAAAEAAQIIADNPQYAERFGVAGQDPTVLQGNLEDIFRTYIDKWGEDAINLLPTYGRNIKPYAQKDTAEDITPGATQEPNVRLHKDSDGNTVAASLEGSINFGIDVASKPELRTVCGQLLFDAHITPDDLAIDSGVQGAFVDERLKLGAVNVWEKKATAILTAINSLGGAADSVVYDLAQPRTYDTGKYPDGTDYKVSINYRPNGRLNFDESIFTTPSSTPSNDFEPSGLIAQARTALAANLLGMTKTRKTDSANDDFIKNLKKSGWTSANTAYFLMIQKGNSSGEQLEAAKVLNSKYSTHDKANPVIRPNPNDTYAFLFGNDTVSTDDDQDTYSLAQALKDRRTDFFGYVKCDGSDELSNTTGSDFQSSMQSNSSKGSSAGFIQKALGSIADVVQKGITGTSGEPLVNIAKLGQDLMLGSEISFLVMLVVTIALSVTPVATFFGNPMYIVVHMLRVTLFTMIFNLLGILWAFGMSLGLVIPLTPGIIFYAAVMSWFVLCIEGIIAAQLYAMNLLNPRGDELGKAAPGLLILFGIALRPVLTIIGFIFGSRLFTVFVSYLKFGFSTTLVSISMEPVIIGAILMPLFLYTAILFSVVSQCFSLIYKVPDQILRWIGGPVEQTDAELVSEATAAGDAAGKTGSATASGAGKAGADLQEKGTQAAAKKKGQESAGGAD